MKYIRLAMPLGFSHSLPHDLRFVDIARILKHSVQTQTAPRLGRVIFAARVVFFDLSPEKLAFV